MYVNNQFFSQFFLFSYKSNFLMDQNSLQSNNYNSLFIPKDVKQVVRPKYFMLSGVHPKNFVLSSNIAGKRDVIAYATETSCFYLPNKGQAGKALTFDEISLGHAKVLRQAIP